MSKGRLTTAAGLAIPLGANVGSAVVTQLSLVLQYVPSSGLSNEPDTSIVRSYALDASILILTDGGMDRTFKLIKKLGVMHVRPMCI